ncbi:MAG: hypothetical protein J5925_04485 [Clostridia bacterium]|nr:hypothetical protein [Clostridia bacterium]MBR4799974.1 hypothetical protein [Clostridia bacterium]
MSGILTALGRYLPPRVEYAAAQLPPEILANADEIRLRRDSAASVTCGGRNVMFDKNGVPSPPDRALRPTKSEMDDCLARLCGGSVYTCEAELAQGFVPLPEGGRAGVCGRAEMRNGAVAGFSEIYSVDLRYHRFIRDAAAPLVRVYSATRLCGALVISPPGVGKTTFLRSAAYLLANGRGIAPARTAVADERCEISVCLPRSGLLDVLTGVPKAQGITMLTRCMSPQAVLCDEISGAEWESVLETQNCGAALIASAHGESIADVLSRPGMEKLLRCGAFALTVLLKRGFPPEIKGFSP